MPAADALAALARPSGAFAMLALDQRESLRTMLAAARDGDVPDSALSSFKVDAARVLSPFASAVLIDVPYGFAPIRAAGAIAPGVGCIVAADRLTQARDGPVEDTDVDDDVLADDAIAAVADAYKLLVIWNLDRPRDRMLRAVARFVRLCSERDRPAIVEAIVRTSTGPLDSARHADAVLAAAREIGELRPDMYKAEVPTLGAAPDDEVMAASGRLTEALACPWVVLSNGTSGDRFADAAVAACRGGASGFLAGRAIWSASIGAPDMRRDLETAAAARLAGLATRIDGVARPWWAAAGGTT